MASEKRKKLRRKPGEGSYKERANGTYEYRVSVGSALKSFYGRTKDDAFAKYEQYLRDNPHGPPRLDQLQPFNELLNLWLGTKIKPPAGAESTYRNYKRLLKTHVAPRIGTTKLCDLTLYVINAFLVERFESTGHGRMVEILRNIMRSACQYGLQGGTLDSNPAEYATVPTFQRRKATALTLEQCRMLLDAAQGKRDVRSPYVTCDGKTKKFPPADSRLWVLYLLALTTGLRKGELLGLQWDDLHGTKLFIQRTVDMEGVIQERTKTEASHAVLTLDSLLCDALHVHQERMKKEGLESPLMFPSTRGTILPQRNLDRHFKTLLEMAGLPNIRFHDLRHSAGSLMLEAGGSLAHVSRALRHANPQVTAKLYLHGSDDGAGKAIAGVSKKLMD